MSGRRFPDRPIYPFGYRHPFGPKTWRELVVFEFYAWLFRLGYESAKLRRRWRKFRTR